MLWTRRWAIAGLIVAAQVGVVVVLAQCWQTSNAANPPSSVSCKRDVPVCTEVVRLEGKETPPPAAQVVPPPAEPPTELRAIAPPSLPAPVPAPAVEVTEGPSAPPAPTPLPPPNLDPTPAPAPAPALAPAPTIAPVAPPPVPEPDRPSVMPVPIAPPPADIAPPKIPAPQVAEASGSALVAPPAAPTPPTAPVSPEMKPIAKSDDLPPPMVSDPPPPAPEQKIKPTPPTVVEGSAPSPMVVEIPQPTAPPTKPASPPKQEITCPWTLRIENVEGRAHLEARNGKEVQFRVVCSELDVQAPRGYIQAIGDVVVNGHEMQGTCKKLTINWHDEHVQLDGGVFLKCHKDGQDIEVKGEKLSFRLSVISSVRADTTSDAPVRRAVID
jgi:hypothetical protein